MRFFKKFIFSRHSIILSCYTMPEKYIFTVTFDSFKSLKKKEKLIEKFYSIVQKYINRNGELFYTIEYHKKSDKKSNNYFRPHLHGIMTVDGVAPRYMLENLVYEIKSKYGKIIQFQLQEDEEEVEGWRAYCMKDVADNELKSNKPHTFTYPLFKREKNGLAVIDEPDSEDEFDL